MAMYIQQPRAAEEPPIRIPENYSGTAMYRHAVPEEPAFLSPEGQASSERQNEPVLPPVVGDIAEEEGETVAVLPEERETVTETADDRAHEAAATPALAPARAAHPPQGGLLSGLFSRVPFLSQLLPPRHHGKTAGGDIALLAGLCLLVADGEGGEGDDILPLLLLLLFLQ